MVQECDVMSHMGRVAGLHYDVWFSLWLACEWGAVYRNNHGSRRFRRGWLETVAERMYGIDRLPRLSHLRCADFVLRLGFPSAAGGR